MGYNGCWKKIRRILALSVALALFLNGWSNYDFTALAAGNDLTVTLDSDSSVYKGTDVTPDIVSAFYGDGGAEVDNTGEIEISWEKDGASVSELKDAGAYTGNASYMDADGNHYTGSVSFEIIAVDLSACSIEYEPLTYNGQGQTPRITVKDSEQNEINALWYTCTIKGSDGNEVSAVENAGTYTVVVTPSDDMDGNVTGTCEGQLTVNKKSLADSDISVSLSPAEVIYTGKEKAIDVGVSFGDITLTEDQDYTVDIPGSMTAVGEHLITVEAVDDSNYTGSASAYLTVRYGEAKAYSSEPSETLTDNVYPSELKVTADEGYTVGSSADSCDETSITFGSTETSDVRIYLKNGESGEISEITMSPFIIDTVSPEITVQISDEDSWTKSKEIEVTASGPADELYGIYYAEEDVLSGTSIVTSEEQIDSLDLQRLEDGKMTVGEDIGADGKTCYIYAIDKAGHVAKKEINVAKIDTEAPEIELSTEISNWDAENNIYWKNADTLDIPVSISDDSSGFLDEAAAELTKDGSVMTGGLSLELSDGGLGLSGTVNVSEAGSYTITVKDQAENEAETVSFEVRTDTGIPSVTLGEPVVDGETAYMDSENTYWTGTGSISIPLTVTDDLGTGESEKSSYTVIYSTTADFGSAKRIDCINGQGVLEAENLEEEVTYYFKVADLAGNEGDVRSVTAACDESGPNITAAVLTQLNGDDWINAEELGEEGKVVLKIEVSDGETGIRSIQYSSDNGDTYNEAENCTEDNGVYIFSTNESYTDSADYKWKVNVINNVGLSSEKELTGGKIDTKEPEGTAYICFSSDAAGKNSGMIGTENNDGGWLSKIFDFVSGSWEKIWGKTKIEFDVYVQDVTSGVKSIVIEYNGDGTKAVLSPDDGLTKEEGLTAFIGGNDGSQTVDENADPTNASGYAVFKGSIEISENETLAVKAFKITSMMDEAGNERTEPLALGNISDEDIIFLDSTAPALNSVTVGGESVTDEDSYFFTGSVNVTLEIEERFFETDGLENMPEITVYQKTSGKTEFTDTIDVGEIEWKNTSGYCYTADIELPEQENSEIEYQICLKYEDPSGNPLDNGSGMNGVENGEYKSKILIVDELAPKLVSYKVNDSTYTVNGTPIYENNGSEEGDIEVTFVVDDNENYRTDDRRKFEVEVYSEDDILVADTEGLTEEISLEESSSERRTTYCFKFDGAGADPEEAYYVVVRYADAAGNLMEAESGDLTVSNGEYTSSSYIIDHVSPVFTIEYSDAYRLIDGENADYTGSGKTPVAGMTSYYKSDVEITVTVDEKYLVPDEYEIADFVKFQLNGSDAEMTWKQSGTVHTGTYVIEKDGDYTVSVSCLDPAANKMVKGDAVQGGEVTDGAYISPVLVLDKTKPVISVGYTAEPVNTYNGRNYFDQSVNLVITVDDENIRYGELQEILSGMTAADSSGGSVDTAAENFVDGIEVNKLHRSANSAYSGAWEVTIPLSTEANYDIPVAFTDLAGNSAVYKETLKSCVDTTEPEALDLSWSVSSSGFMDAVNYKDFGFLFADHKLTIHADASDATAGIRLIKFTVTDENGKVTELTKPFAPSASGSYEIAVPLETSDFKGTVKAETFDWSENISDEIRGSIVESPDKHSSTGSAVITTRTSPNRTVGGEDFYNTDVNFNLSLKDTYSGLREWSYSGGSTLSGAMNYAKEAGGDLSKTPSEAITYEYSVDLTLDSSQNNDNDVKVSAEYTDNAGHTGNVEQLYNIDITVPVITVEYDLNDPANERFYNQTRTATVTIRERNFDPDDVDFTITNTDGTMPVIGSWSESGSGDDTKHVCQVIFSADGDYTFTVAFEDMAGNKADYDRVDEFTIDQTRPVLNVTWDNNQSSHEYYYAQSRTATIDILEHNFDPAFIDVTMTANGAGVPSVSGWSRNGDHNIATVTFSADADYTFDISGMDQADNLLDDYEMERFVIDQTAPELEIFDIENMSANNGIVMPGVRYHDTNYDADATVILMKGYHNGIQEMNGTTTRTADGMEIKLNDFEHIPEVDDLYTMEATVYDLAGNSSEASVIFSVNRFGSVYTFDNKTDELVGDNGKYYTNQEQDIVVIETNVDTLEFKEITCNLNGDLRTLTEGEDFTVGMSGSDVSWKQYTYTIDEKNFVEEGTYILTIYSEDRATNTSDNNTKGKKVEFVVDKTSPSILIAGVENDGQYRENSREVTLDVQDNIRLAEVEVTLDGKTTTYSASELSERDGKIVFSVGSANQWQHMSVTAYDAAGNNTDSEELRFLITSNILVQFYMNKVLFYSTIGILLLLGLGTWWFLILAKRRKEKEEEK